MQLVGSVPSSCGPHRSSPSRAAERPGSTPPQQPVEDFVERISALVGSPEQIVDKVLRYREVLGHEMIHLHLDGDGLSPAHQRQMLEQFQPDVAPALRPQRRVEIGDHVNLPLSILDLAPVPRGGTAADALNNSLDLARVAERAGYLRYWVAEHHLVPGVASSSTPVLVALIASATERIRVGSGAVLLPNTGPLQVAEQFGTVAAVHPGRIDLGMGRFDLHKVLRLIRAAQEAGSGKPGAPPPPPPARVVDGLHIPSPARFIGDPSGIVHLAVLLGFSADDPAPDYDEQVAAILDYFAGTAKRDDGVPVTVLPAEGADLDLWVLGSSPGESAQVAAARGLPFAANYHLFPTTVLETVEAYRAAFRPSARLSAPRVMVSADVVVAETDEQARYLAAPYGQWVLDIRSGRGAEPYVTPDEALARVWTEQERAAVADRVETQFVGSPATVVEQLATLARVTRADELLVTTITTEHADRVRSTELLAQAWADRGGA